MSSVRCLWARDCGIPEAAALHQRYNGLSRLLRCCIVFASNQLWWAGVLSWQTCCQTTVRSQTLHISHERLLWDSNLSGNDATAPSFDVVGGSRQHISLEPPVTSCRRTHFSQSPLTKCYTFVKQSLQFEQGCTAKTNQAWSGRKVHRTFLLRCR